MTDSTSTYTSFVLTLSEVGRGNWDIYHGIGSRYDTWLSWSGSKKVSSSLQIHHSLVIGFRNDHWDIFLIPCVEGVLEHIGKVQFSRGWINDLCWYSHLNLVILRVTNLGTFLSIMIHAKMSKSKLEILPENSCTTMTRHPQVLWIRCHPCGGWMASGSHIHMHLPMPTQRPYAW